jgi:dTDP-4-amino-4,6-dideoxygalactose transaminase
MITVSDPKIAKKMRTLRLHGIDREISGRYHGKGGAWRYEVVAAGFKSNLTDIAAAIGIVQLKRAWNFHRRRRELWERYNRALAHLPLLPPPPPHAEDIHGHHLYAIRLLADAPIDRDSFIARMADLGVNCNVHFIPLHLHPYWRETLNVSEEMFPEAQKVFDGLVTLPLFTLMSDDMQQYVVDAIHDVLS